MNTEKQRIAIAKVCGWKLYGSINGRLLMWPPGQGDACEPPDYPQDLNAMHEVEKTLNPSALLGESPRWDAYVNNLYEHGKVHGFHATASERAEAFLRTLNLWEE